MNEQLTRCQVFTPKNKVNKVLDLIGYNTNILDKRIVENSFGKGNFLIEIVRRYIEEAISKGYKSLQIKEMLRDHIFGYEIDESLFKYTLNRLNNVCLKYQLTDVQWSLKNVNTLEYNDNNTYHYIVGNPPYISYHQLSVAEREYLRKNYQYCENGLFDIYYAFVEWAINHSCLLNGKIGYIIPNGIYKNKSAKKLRDVILPHLHTVIDYKRHNVFKGKLTTVTILHLDFEIKQDYFHYTHSTYSKIIKKSDVDYMGKWIFTKFKRTDTGLLFGDFFDVKNSVATLHNKIFILRDYSEDNDNIIVGNHRIEKSITKYAVSIKSLEKSSGSESIIFPYKIIDGNISCFKEKELQSDYPFVYDYLLSYKVQLEKETRDKSTQWFEYGRTQSINSVVKSKILIPRILTDEFHTEILDQNTIPYSGIIITPKDKYSINECIKILNSNRFKKYLRIVSTNLQGKSIQLSTTDIKNYMFNETDLR